MPSGHPPGSARDRHTVRVRLSRANVTVTGSNRSHLSSQQPPGSLSTGQGVGGAVGIGQGEEGLTHNAPDLNLAAQEGKPGNHRAGGAILPRSLPGQHQRQGQGLSISTGSAGGHKLATGGQGDDRISAMGQGLALARGEGRYIGVRFAAIKRTNSGQGAPWQALL